MTQTVGGEHRLVVHPIEREEHNGTTSSTSAAQHELDIEPQDFLEEDENVTPTNWRSLLTDIANMLKAFIGLNFLYVAYAFAQAGLVRGIVGLTFIALITEHCCLLLVDVKSRMPERPSGKPPTYGDIAKFVGGRPCEYLITAALMLTQFGYCVGYLIFISQTVHDVLQRANYPVWPYVLVPVPLLLTIAMLKSIRSLGPFSFLANAALLTGFVAVVVYIGKHFKIQTGYASWGTFPLFFGQMTAALEGIGLVIPVETSMKDPSQFPFVLRTALFVLTAVLMTVGTLGYMTFGQDTKSILLLNFGQSPIVNIVKVILILGILFTYPLQIFPVFQLFEVWMAKRQEKRRARQNNNEAVSSTQFSQITGSSTSAGLSASETEGEEDPEREDADESHIEVEKLMGSTSNAAQSESTERRERFVSEPWKIAFRFAIVVLTAITAMLAGANFGLFQSLVGSLGASALAYSAPAYFHVRVFGRTLTPAEKMKDWLIFAFGVIGAVVGTIVTLMEFAEQQHHAHAVPQPTI